MSTNEEIHNALVGIHSRLGTIEGKVNLAARANRERLRAELEAAMRKDPLLGQIYLLLDGKRNQVEIKEALAEFGITPSQPTISRRMGKLATEHGVADLVEGGAQLVLRKDREAENILNLSTNIRKWLSDLKEPIPERPKRRPRRAP
ncbi:MAG: hypothetical protein M3198_10640 [Actinomycetota bacterium]|nr:hypothetical protein [Actinomycetota bacterium]